VPLESYRSLGFANYHLNVFTFSWLQTGCASGFKTWKENMETNRGPPCREVSLLGLIAGEKISLLALSSHAVSVSFSLGRHRYADLWRLWNTILIRPLLPLISSLCLAGDLRCSFMQRMRLFGKTAYAMYSNIADLSDIKYVCRESAYVKFEITEC